MSEEEKQPERIEFDAELKRYYEARPFVSFDIVTSSGHEYRIDEPNQVAFGANAIVVVQPRTGVWIIRKNQISALHVHDAA